MGDFYCNLQYTTKEFIYEDMEKNKEHERYQQFVARFYKDQLCKLLLDNDAQLQEKEIRKWIDEEFKHREELLKNGINMYTEEDIHQLNTDHTETISLSGTNGQLNEFNKVGSLTDIYETMVKFLCYKMEKIIAPEEKKRINDHFVTQQYRLLEEVKKKVKKEKENQSYLLSRLGQKLQELTDDIIDKEEIRYLGTVLSKKNEIFIVSNQLFGRSEKSISVFLETYLDIIKLKNNNLCNIKEDSWYNAMYEAYKQTERVFLKEHNLHLLDINIEREKFDAEAKIESLLEGILDDCSECDAEPGVEILREGILDDDCLECDAEPGVEILREGILDDDCVGVDAEPGVTTLLEGILDDDCAGVDEALLKGILDDDCSESNKIETEELEADSLESNKTEKLVDQCSESNKIEIEELVDNLESNKINEKEHILNEKNENIDNNHFNNIKKEKKYDTVYHIDQENDEKYQHDTDPFDIIVCKFEDTISQDTNTTNSSHGKDADQLECKDANQLDDKKDNITVCELKDDDQLDDKKDNITACELKEDTISRDIDPVRDVNNFQSKKSKEKKN